MKPMTKEDVLDFVRIVAFNSKKSLLHIYKQSLKAACVIKLVELAEKEMEVGN